MWNTGQHKVNVQKPLEIVVSINDSGQLSHSTQESKGSGSLVWIINTVFALCQVLFEVLT